MARSSLGVGASRASDLPTLNDLIRRVTVADAAYTVLVGDRVVAYTSLTAARVVSLPAASAYPTGTRLTIIDESGSCSVTNTLTISRAGTDTINGAVSAVLTLPRGYIALMSDGSSKWTVVDGFTTTTNATFGTVYFGSSVGTKLDLYGGAYTISISGGSIDYAVNGTGSFHTFKYASTTLHRLGGTSGSTYFLSIDSTPIGAVTASTARFSSLQTTTGNVTLGDASVANSVTVYVNGQAGYSRSVFFMSSGVNRFAFGVNQITESGSNAGTNFGIYTYKDDGSFLANPLLITRSTGYTNLISLENTPIGQVTSSTAKFTNVALTSAAGTAGLPTKISLYGQTFGSGDYGWGISTLSLDACVASTSAFHSFYYGGVIKHRLGGTAGTSYLLSLDNTPIGATTPSTVTGTVVAATTKITNATCTVATPPLSPVNGDQIVMTNMRVFTSMGTLEASGAGTGGLATYNSGTSTWRVAGTSQQALS